MFQSELKICFLIPSLNAGGIETYLLRFLQQIDNEISTVVIIKSDEKGDLFHEYLKTGTKITHKKIGYLNLIAWLRLYKFFKFERFTAICDMGANFAGIPLTIARCAKIKKRVAFYRQSSHHFSTTGYKLMYARFVNWLVIKHATVILTNSQHALNFYFNKRIDNRFKVIKNGVNKELFEIEEDRDQLRKYFGLPNDKIIVGHTGRVVHAKNHQTIFKVARSVCLDNKNVVFVLAGNGTRDLPDQDGMITLGYCSEIPKLLKTFDLFYFPSITEGQPNALIEAMISGLPFVASDIPPIKECVPESHFSQLVMATDIQASKEKIEEIIRSNYKDNYCCKIWSINEYDASINYKRFIDELI